MPHRSLDRGLCRGFSLVELLLVLLVIALAVTLVSVNVGVDKSAYALRQQARDFANETSLVLQEAVLMRRQWGVDLYRDFVDGEEYFAYRWLTLTDTGWREQAPTGLVAGHSFPSVVVLQLMVEGSEQGIGMLELEPEKADEQSELKPDIWLLSSGEISSFELSFNYHQSDWEPLIVMGDQLGRIQLLEGDEDARE